MEARNQRWDDGEFAKELDRIRHLWPTFRDFDLDEIAAYHCDTVGRRTFAEAYRRARRAGAILLSAHRSARKRAILDAIFELRKGDVAAGVSRAIESGVYEFPYAVNQCNRGKMLVCRDTEGAVRYPDTGLLPFDAATKRWHRERLERRCDATRESTRAGCGRNAAGRRRWVLTLTAC